MSDGESPLIKALRQAVRSAPEQAEFRVALAEALIDDGDSEGAIVELGEALRLEPGSARARELMLAALSGGTWLSARFRRGRRLPRLLSRWRRRQPSGWR